jgi:hypothetical protein
MLFNSLTYFVGKIRDRIWRIFSKNQLLLFNAEIKIKQIENSFTDQVFIVAIINEF